MSCTSSSRLEESGAKPLGGADNGGGGRDYITVEPFVSNPTTLQEALGERRGTPFSVQNALDGANPYYSSQQLNEASQSDFENNCQRCVVAYEARRRGYDVVALPTYAEDTMPSAYNWMKAFKGAKTIDVGASNPKTAQANLEKQMKSFGHGARGIVAIPHHVFNVENVNGKIRYVDAQTNTVYNSNNVFSRLGRKGSSSIELIRTDNLPFSSEARKSVTQTTERVKRFKERKRK